MARIFKVLGDENRLAILLLLSNLCRGHCSADDETVERTVGEIAREFDLALSTVSHHLKQLRDAGLIVCEKHGQRVHCALNTEAVEAIEAFFRNRSG